MNIYKYKMIDENKNVINLCIIGNSKSEVVKYLYKKNIIFANVKRMFFVNRDWRVISNILSQLCCAISNGKSLINIIQYYIDTTNNQFIRNTLSSILIDIESGTSFSTAWTQSGITNNYIDKMLSAAEKSSSMHLYAEDIKKYSFLIEKTKKIFSNVILYSSIQLIIVFSSFCAINIIFNKSIYFYILCICVLIGLCSLIVKKWYFVSFVFPFIKNIILSFCVIEFALSMHYLLKITDTSYAVESSVNSITNKYIKQNWTEMIIKIKSGYTLVDAAKSTKMMHKSIISTMMQTDMESSFKVLVDILSDDIEHLANIASKILNIILMLISAMFVGYTIFSEIIPLYDIKNDIVGDYGV